jgi:predicted transglutaminase-like cysteine proteinase
MEPNAAIHRAWIGLTASRSHPVRHKKLNFKPFLEFESQIRDRNISNGFKLRVSVSSRRGFGVLLVLTLTSMGFAMICAASLLMCVASLTVVSSLLKASDPHYAETRFLSAQLLLRGEFRFDTTVDRAAVAKPQQRDVQFIRLDVPTLPPMAFTQFCLKYANECKPHRMSFGGGRLKATDQRLAELDRINRAVNSSILPEQNKEGLAGEKWLLGPVLGDCNDYAVTKRHQLTADGWPARDVLLSEVVTVSGEHHLIVVVRTSDGDLVLDNLTDRIMPWFHKLYRWVRIQTPENPNYWASIPKQDPDALSL